MCLERASGCCANANPQCVTLSEAKGLIALGQRWFFSKKIHRLLLRNDKFGAEPLILSLSKDLLATVGLC